MDPPVSEPRARSHILAAIAAALPPLDPPGMRPGAAGLSVWPKHDVSVELPAANSSILVIPIMIPSSAFIRRVTVAS